MPPRLLFITNEPPHTVAAGSIYFHRLFADYPADRIRVITNSPLPSADQLLSCEYTSHRIGIDRLKQTRFWMWRSGARVLGGANLMSLKRVDRLIGDYKPDVVVTLMQDSWYYELAERYARKYDLPLILFIHDLPHGFEPVASWLRIKQLERDRKVYESAAARICVSPGMEAWFSSFYGLQGDILLPPRSPHPATQDPNLCKTLKVQGRLTLGYAGGLHYGYGEQIAAMIPMMRLAQTRLEIFGPAPSGALIGLKDATDVLTFHGYAATPEGAWAGLLARCDAVLLPYLDPPKNHHIQYQTHFPSKLGDMLSLGLPLLVTGPKDASGVKWCLNNNVCLFASSDAGETPLLERLLQLREISSSRIKLATDAKVQSSAFDANHLRLQLNEILNRFSH